MGGATKAFLSYLGSIIHLGVTPLVVVPNHNGIYKKLQESGIATCVLNYRPQTYPKWKTAKDIVLFLPRMVGRLMVNHIATYRLVTILKDFHPDLIHTNVSVINIGYMAARRMKIPHIYHIREYADKDFGMHYFPRKRSFQKQLRKSHSYSICITKDIQNYHREKDHVSSRVIYDGVHPATTTYPKEEKQGYLLYAGRIEPAKGLDLLLKAYTKVIRDCGKDSLPPLWVAGHIQQPLFHNELKQYIEDENIDGKVRWLGEVENIKEFMRHAQALVIPSRSEGFGLCMPEAMFEGCLCIAHNTGGTKEQLDNGRKLKRKEIAFGYNSTNELAEILKNLFNGTIKKEETDVMIADAFEVVNKLYSTEANAENVFKFYKEIQSR